MNSDIQIAKKTLQTEISALKKLSSTFGQSSQFSKAVNLISKTRGKVLVVGVGKSYIIGIKVSSTLSSLGTPSVAFNATDLQHGGLGAIQKSQDVLLVFSVSGESSELNNILRYANRHKINIIGVSCKSTSMLLRNSTIKFFIVGRLFGNCMYEKKKMDKQKIYIYPPIRYFSYIINTSERNYGKR